MGVFKYTTLSALRDEGVSESELSDKKVFEKIEEKSRLINELTGVFFIPLLQTREFDGHASSIVRLDAPLLEAISVEVDRDRSHFRSQRVTVAAIEERDRFGFLPRVHGKDFQLSGILGGSDYVNGEWSLKSFVGVFPLGESNVKVKGYFGWQERETKASSVTTTELSSDSEDILVENANGFRKGQCVIFLLEEEVKFIAFLRSVEFGTKKLVFVEAAKDLEGVVETGAEVISFGRVPVGIEKACRLMVVGDRFPAASSEHEEAIAGRLIESEKIDNYTYKLGRKAEQRVITGDPVVDALLLKFCRPSTVRVI